MKKLIFISLLGFFLLAGCRQKILPAPNPTQTNNNSTLLFSDTWTYSEPTIKVSIWTGILLAEFGSKVPNEISRTASKEDKQNGRKWSTVTGYLYTYTYQDLGITITTHPLYEPYFSKKTDTPIFKRSGNIIYPSGNSDRTVEYIQMFDKKSSVPLQSIIKQRHLGTWCITYLHFQDSDPMNDNRFTEKWAGIDINNFFDITWPDWTLGSDIECRPDKDFPENYSSIFFVQSIHHKNKYYKISMGDWCAPGPCSIFWTIEFF